MIQVPICDLFFCINFFELDIHRHRCINVQLHAMMQCNSHTCARMLACRHNAYKHAGIVSSKQEHISMEPRKRTPSLRKNPTPTLKNYIWGISEIEFFTHNPLRHTHQCTIIAVLIWSRIKFPSKKLLFLIIIESRCIPDGDGLVFIFLGFMETSHFVICNITKLLSSFRQIIQFSFRENQHWFVFEALNQTHNLH